jgi:VanZ family protein
MTFSIVRQARVVAWTLAVAVIILSFIPPGLRPETGAPHFLEHFSIYVILGAVFAIGYNKNQRLLAILFVIFGGVIEAAQLFAPGRHARLSDFVVDTLGMYVGLLAVALAVRVRTPRLSLLKTRQNADHRVRPTAPAE